LLIICEKSDVLVHVQVKRVPEDTGIPSAYSGNMAFVNKKTKKTNATKVQQLRTQRSFYVPEYYHSF
jgi:hypothetical protein